MIRHLLNRIRRRPTDWAWCADHPDLIDRRSTDWAAVTNLSKER